MQRIAVIGTSCSGKTTLARSLAKRLGSPHIELDAFHWGPNWTELPDEIMRQQIDERTQAESWVSCGNYSMLRDIVWPRADTIVWLNYSFPVIGSRALRRTFRRSLRREELWAGNRESLRKAFLSQDSILLWVLRTYRKHRREYPRVFARPEHAHLRVIELRHPREAEVLLDELSQS